MDDEIYKSYGVLKYARKLSLKDSMVLISQLVTGISLGVLQFAHNGRYNINELIMDIQPAEFRQGDVCSRDRRIKSRIYKKISP